MKNGNYPSPDGARTIAYSGGAVWYQGTVGSSVTNTVSQAGARISKTPTDPLNPSVAYVYSVLAFGKGYQMKADWEGERVAWEGESGVLGIG